MAGGWDAPGLVDAAMQQLQNAVVITDADLVNGGPHVLLCNRAFLEMTGYGRDEILGRNLRILQGPKTDRAVIARLRECLRQNRYFEGLTVNYRKDGTPYHVQWSISPVRDGSGRVTHYVSVQQDMTARLRAEAERDMLAGALQVVADPIMVTDEDDRIVYVNRAFERVTGYRAEAVLGRTPDLLYNGLDEEVRGAGVSTGLDDHGTTRRQVAIRTRDGQVLHTVRTVTPYVQSFDHAGRTISAFSDVTQYVEAAEELRERAATDSLTGLRNRRAGDAALRAWLDALRPDGPRLSVAMCDIDHFKRVNDRFGHAAGDRVLRHVADRLADGLGSDDVVVRWGGEEFLLVLPTAVLDDAVRTAERLRAALEAAVDDEVGTVTSSIGVAEAGPDDDVHSLLTRADQALYEAKASGRNRVRAR